MAFTFEQLRQFATNAGFQGKNADTAAAIALAESSGKPNAVGDPQAGGSYGLMQINQNAHPGTAATALDPQGSFNLAYDISGGGTNFAPWTTYKTGAYQSYLPSGTGSSDSLSYSIVNDPSGAFGGKSSDSLDPYSPNFNADTANSNGLFGGGNFFDLSGSNPTASDKSGGVTLGDYVDPTALAQNPESIDPYSPNFNIGAFNSASQQQGAATSQWWNNFFQKMQNLGGRLGIILLGGLIIAVGAYAAAHGELGETAKAVVKAPA